MRWRFEAEEWLIAIVFVILSAFIIGVTAKIWCRLFSLGWQLIP